MTGRDVDVVVVGDGPAGTALAAACRAGGLSVLLVGPGEPWPNTYGAWVDELEGIEILAGLRTGPFAAVANRVVAHGDRHHELGRAYGTLDNTRVRHHLLAGVDHLAAQARSVHETVNGAAVMTSIGPGASTTTLHAGLVIDATGAGGAFLRRPSRAPTPAWQTAFGVIVDELPADASVDLDAATLMDFREPPGVPGVGAPTFCYAVPVADGWLVEETVLAARPAIDPDALRARLAGRLGRDGPAIVAEADRTERVRIPMGLAPPRPPHPVVPFGAAAGYIHPATGFSVTASLRAASRVALAIANDVAPPVAWSAVWPASARRTSALHRYGGRVLAGFDARDTRAFFDAFFELPPDRWAAYLRIDADPTEVARVMGSVFARAPWRIRRRLAIPGRGGPPTT